MHTSRALITVAVVAASALGALAGPAGAAAKPVARYHLENAWPAHAGQAGTLTAIAQAESAGYGKDGAKGGNVEFEWKVEEGES